VTTATGHGRACPGHLRHFSNDGWMREQARAGEGENRGPDLDQGARIFPSALRTLSLFEAAADPQQSLSSAFVQSRTRAALIKASSAGEYCPGHGHKPHLASDGVAFNWNSDERRRPGSVFWAPR
jgi:hypothetical protein